MGGRRIPTIPGSDPVDALFAADMLCDDDPGVLDLHGMTVEEARAALDLFLDHSLVAELNRVKVIHGKGQGTLAMFVRDALGKDKRVKTFRPSTNQIGAAVVALLKSG